MLRSKNRRPLFARYQPRISQPQGRAYTYHADLLRRLQQGDPAAWEHFVTEWGARMYSYLRYNARTEEDAQSLLHETMLTIVRELPPWNGQLSLVSFIYKVAYRRVQSYWRGGGKAELSAWLNREITDIAKAEVGDALQQMEEHSQQALLLRYHAGLTIREIADVLGRPIESIEGLLSQVTRQFQPLFFKGAGS